MTDDASDKSSMPDDINLDFDRQNRTGLAEAIFCAGKSDAQLNSIVNIVTTQNKSMLFTRLSEAQFAALAASAQTALEYDPVSETAFHLPVAKPLSPQQKLKKIAVVTGGSSDLSVAREATRTLEFYGYAPLQVHDVGVAGLWRITERLDELRQCDIIICVAGMDAALPTVMGGLVGSVLIAVPTSVGYGAVNGGETALRALLVSCASGLTVTNIDNGFGAACAAIRMLNNFGTAG